MAVASSEEGVPAGLLEALSSPSFYPHRPATVERRETHISWVFLAGDRVLKVKKPIRLPFLDYGTLERRRSFCLDEVTLNRRLAPDVYLGMRSIVQGEHGFELGAPGDPAAVEYAVEMRRFDEERTLDRLLGRGEVTAAELQAVGGRIGEFHRAAAPVKLGPPEALAALHRTVQETLETLLDAAGDAVDVRDVVSASRFSLSFLAARRAQLLERCGAGLWRDGHGDLRAEHVVLDHGIDVVDCIEFDPSLRQIDVAFDLAFLAMEVEKTGTRELADALVAGYRAAGGDTGDDGLLAFYAAHRALIRAKVALLRARQVPKGKARRASEAEGARLFSVGRRLAWRARLPLALVVCGAPAAGKTHLARALAEASGLPRVNSDIVRKRLAGIDARERAGRAHYSESFSARTYGALAAEAAATIGSSRGVIVDATFRRAYARHELVKALAGTGARVVFVECRAPADVLLDRARRRASDADAVSDATADVVERLRREFEPLDEVEPRHHLLVRSDRPADESAREVEARLDLALFG